MCWSDISKESLVAVLLSYDRYLNKEGINILNTCNNDNFLRRLLTFSFYVFSDAGCVSLKEKSTCSYGEIENVPMSWFETPTIIYTGGGGNISFY